MKLRHLIIMLVLAKKLTKAMPREEVTVTAPLGETKPKEPERYPHEHAIEDLVQRHFGLDWSFKVARQLPHSKHSQALMAIRQLVYDAMSDSFNKGIEFQKSGKVGVHV